ncbi:MAG: hypothetical protein Phyf2KO_16190 [Phycisphaerales bacterium]
MDAPRLAFLALGLAAAPVAAQPVVIAGQSPETPASSVISADEPGGSFVYDDQRAGETLVPARKASAERIRFWGGSESSLEDDTNTLGFRVSIYDLDQNTGALSLVTQRRVSRGFVSPTDTSQTMGDMDAKVFSYEFDLGEAIGLDGQNEYVVSVSAITFVPPRDSRESWTWATASGDGVIHLDLFDGQGLAPASGVANGLAVELIGQMEAPECLADVNQDGSLTPADFTAWISAYTSGDMRADQNSDGAITPSDFTAWVTNFNAGC